ncbi:MAG: tRNA epoxyqueuosine(34) reductase QueG [Halothiobacillus sp.]
MDTQLIDLNQLKNQIHAWAIELGFDDVRVTDTDLSRYEQGYLDWIAQNYHGTMAYMATHGLKRFRPQELVPGTRRVLSVRKNYFPPDVHGPRDVLQNPQLGYISRYALGRDYHKVLRGNVQKLAERIIQEIGGFGYRAFVDSAPVYETGLAEKSGIGWKGKHSLVLNREAGSWFFLGELFIDFDLPVDEPIVPHCGSCTACITVCPTQAIIADGVVDARRCISYITIESAEDIPEAFRADMGNRIYGCDDCQLACPWNRFAKIAADADFRARHGLDAPSLIELFGWDEATFLVRTEGMAIRRIGWQRWLRNIAVALGNLVRSQPEHSAAVLALKARQGQVSEQLDRHIAWALTQAALAQKI